MGRKKDPAGSTGGGGTVIDVAFHETTRKRYLNYALSVITTRALPDVRDGLKPVQRRILFAMHHDHHLHATAKELKCASVVGTVIGRYHPHGDSAIYEALVRMAQDWNLRYPLVEGHGNFGSIAGDPPAAYRYTEARLQRISAELLDDLGKETVDFRPNFDGNHPEPSVLPARIPQLLVNGSAGIAVGLATSIPPHNLREVCAACVALVEDRSLTVADLLKQIKGPDFPRGGQILNPKAEIRKFYEEGQGTLRVRGEYEVEEAERGAQRIVIKSVPYLLETDKLVQQIAEVIISRKVPQLVDVRNESTEKDGIRIVVELKRESDPALVMSYLYRNTPLQSTFNMNLNCLVPPAAPASSTGAAEDSPDGAAGGGVAGAEAGGGPGERPPPAPGVPRRLDLKSMLIYFIDFRYEVVERRFRHELRLLRERIHILQGFRKIFDVLDEAIRIIRASEGKQDAAEKLIDRFRIDAIQAEAILELKLYKLARLEIKLILEELREKRKAAEEIETQLSSKKRLWTVVKREIQEVGERYGDERRTKIGGKSEETEYDEEAFIVDEDATILLSRDGWVRRVQRVTDLTKVRLRQDDQILAIVGGNSRSTVAFFSNLGVAYSIRINDIPPSPHGFGDPLQRLFKFRDGERAVAAFSFDERALGGSAKAIGKATDGPGDIPALHALAVASSGYGLRFSLFPLQEASTRAGRKFARLREGEEVVEVAPVKGDETLIIATRAGRALLCSVAEVNFLAGPGRGVQVVKIQKDDRVIGAAVGRGEKEGLKVVRDNGSEIDIRPKDYRVTSRAGRGFEVIKRGKLSGILRPPVELPGFLRSEGEGDGPSRRGGAGSAGGNESGNHRGNGNGNGNGVKHEDQ